MDYFSQSQFVSSELSGVLDSLHLFLDSLSTLVHTDPQKMIFVDVSSDFLVYWPLFGFSEWETLAGNQRAKDVEVRAHVCSGQISLQRSLFTGFFYQMWFWHLVCQSLPLPLQFLASGCFPHPFWLPLSQSCFVNNLFVKLFPVTPLGCAHFFFLPLTL